MSIKSKTYVRNCRTRGDWLVNESPSWFRKLYFGYGPQFADFIKDKPWIKAKIKAWMETKIDPNVDLGALKYVILMERYQEEKMGSAALI